MDKRDRATKTLETIETTKLVVACNACGSTQVGLRGTDPPGQLVCDSCGNAMPWDGERFTLIKYDKNHPHTLETLVGMERAYSETEQRAAERLDD